MLLLMLESSPSLAPGGGVVLVLDSCVIDVRVGAFASSAGELSRAILRDFPRGVHCVISVRDSSS